VTLRDEIAKAIVGHDSIVEGVLICLFAGGHALLEGVPGLGKTLLIRTLSDALDLQFARIQFTPDLMPADITGTTVVVESDEGRTFEFRKGPLFAQMEKRICSTDRSSSWQPRIRLSKRAHIHYQKLNLTDSSSNYMWGILGVKI
jgi:MoxR-like ATPase